jgi:hypothetical protein
MIDLNRIGGGVKLLNYILNKTQTKQWSKETFSKIVEKQPNPYLTKTPPSK